MTAKPAPLTNFAGEPIAPSSTWQFQSVVLRTTFRQCTCGERYENQEVFELHTQETRLMGRPHLATRLIPIRSPDLPDRPIEWTTETFPIPVCPKCIEKKQKEVTPAAPLPVSDWAATLRRKEAELQAARAAAKPRPAAQPRNQSITDLEDLFK